MAASKRTAQAALQAGQDRLPVRPVEYPVRQLYPAAKVVRVLTRPSVRTSLHP